MPATPLSIPREQITGLVLSGGQGSRMGGVDKGLQLLAGRPLAEWAAERLAAQTGQVLVNANRYLQAYAALGHTVIADLAPAASPAANALAEPYPGPLAGFAAGLDACRTPWLLTVACDTPFFPADLAAELAQAAVRDQVLVAMACTRSPDGHRLPQPTFCLLHASLAASVRSFVDSGGRKVRQWAAQHPMVMVEFNDTAAFYNANTLQELETLARQCPANGVEG
ncbi:molybdenum cofactor guanylyltransferase MobA [Comamonas odontotermitis]|uniref:molybdenum cofactor guanylyltransferase MobA n=1 Tax=Comamonas odontotermitis TaxID=379895 RepID=UPI003751BAAD